MRGRTPAGESLLTVAARYGRALVDFAFPESGCALCGGPCPDSPAWKPEICPECLEDIFLRPHPAAFSGSSVFSSPSARFLDRAVAAGVYGGVLEKGILRLKNVPDRRLARALGRLVAEALWEDVGRPPWLAAGRTNPAERGPVALPWDYIIPVPLHTGRRRERGYNQARLLAEGVASSGPWLPAPEAVREDLVERIRPTPLQTTLSREERARSVLGAFRFAAGARSRAQSGPGDPSLQGLRFLIIDDVMTTGATAGEIARVLKAGGAAGVWAATVARA